VIKVTVLNEAQQERLKEITTNLRHIRQEKSISLEEIAIHTHIRLPILQALEEWRFEELPEAIFIQGFIRRYADKLGLDGSVIAESFPVNIEPLKLNNSPKKKRLYIPLFVPYIFLLAAAFIGLVHLLKPKFTGTSLAKIQNLKNNIQQKKFPSATSKVDSEAVTFPIITPTPSGVMSPTSQSSANVAITLELQGLSWVQVKADGKTEFEGTLSKGESKTWTAKKSLTIRSGNAGVVLVSVNEQQPKLLGNEGQVKEVTYTN
jgi:cytoskeletal protein RodZ